MTALNALVGDLSVELALPIALATYWIPPQKEFAEILDEQPSVAHACEAETSMLLALRPDLVDMTRLDHIDPPREWAGGRSDVYVWQSVADWSPSGVAGVPKAASADKGERLLKAAAEALASRLRDGAMEPALTCDRWLNRSFFSGGHIDFTDTTSTGTVQTRERRHRRTRYCYNSHTLPWICITLTLGLVLCLAS